MHGHVLLEKKDGRRCLYIPEAHVQVYVFRDGRREWVVATFRTDGYYGRTREDTVLTTEHLLRDFTFLREVEVPGHIADFAVDSERRRQEQVGSLEGTFRAFFKEGADLNGFEQTWLTFRDQVAARKIEDDFDASLEQRVGEEVYALLEGA